MKRIIMLYDGHYDDADFLVVPDDIADDIEKVVWDFNIWLRDPKNNFRFMKTENGITCLSIDTNEFLWWLNNVRITGEDKAEIESQHTNFIEGYPVAYF